MVITKRFVDHIQTTAGQPVRIDTPAGMFVFTIKPVLGRFRTYDTMVESFPVSNALLRSIDEERRN